MASDAPFPYVTDVGQTRVTVYMGFVSFMILVWDHIITLGDEIDYIWKGKKGPIVWLFFINRYLSPLGFIINLFAYLSPSWTPEVCFGSQYNACFQTYPPNIRDHRCQHFVRYEGSMTVIGLNVSALMMFLRVYAMYPSNLYMIALVLGAFVVELTVNAWLLTHGIAVIHDSHVHTCTMVFSPDVPAHLASASAWLPLTYDTIVVILTLNRTIKPIRHQTAGKIMRVLLRDGLIVIFAVNLVLTLMIALAPEGIQNITAQLEYLLTVAMMSRITLHLKKQGRLHEVIDWDSGGAHTLRSGIVSAVQPTRLYFARSHHSDRAPHSDSHGTSQGRPTEVTVTIDELVTHDRVDFLDVSNDHDAGTREPSLHEYSDTKKHVEWHEMNRIESSSV
ncbi:hypothetical protein EUX98_g3603 [Antrodiella citrinella]|uniref:DUF6533 domain-containing protein n=1 Tax=Antrodiella citrinella TaxID=2447956 RepID=A0A4S4N498_9APHY|nr:hypothetical protein EUX98_g3603 [Antrodiella citrinella]